MREQESTEGGREGREDRRAKEEQQRSEEAEVSYKIKNQFQLRFSSAGKTLKKHNKQLLWTMQKKNKTAWKILFKHKRKYVKA